MLIFGIFVWTYLDYGLFVANLFIQFQLMTDDYDTNDWNLDHFLNSTVPKRSNLLSFFFPQQISKRLHFGSVVLLSIFFCGNIYNSRLVFLSLSSRPLVHTFALNSPQSLCRPDPSCMVLGDFRHSMKSISVTMKLHYLLDVVTVLYGKSSILYHTFAYQTCWTVFSPLIHTLLTCHKFLGSNPDSSAITFQHRSMSSTCYCWCCQ